MVDERTRATLSGVVDDCIALRKKVEISDHAILIRRNGTEFAVQGSVSPMIAPEGWLMGAVIVLRDVTEARAMAAKLTRMAQQDALTGLANRALLEDRLKQCVRFAGRSRRQFALMFLDLDHFKRINDTLGHAAGDVLLRNIAERITRTLRGSDTASRLGGDEFVVLLPQIERREDAGAVAEKILRAVSQPYDLGGQAQTVSFSIGIAVFPDDGADSEALMHGADAAMYRAKSTGRNRYCYFEQSDRESAAGSN